MSPTIPVSEGFVPFRGYRTWYRVLGAKGAILLKGEPGAEQRLRLRLEGIVISGDRVDLARFGYKFRRADSEPAG